MFYFGHGPASVAVVVAPIVGWIGGQKLVDSKEGFNQMTKEYHDLYKAFMELSDGVQKVEELELLFDEVLDVVEFHTDETIGTEPSESA